MRLIDSVILAQEIASLKVYIAGRPATLDEAKSDVLQVIDDQKTVDAVEVVRCKDCKHCCTIDTRKKGERSKLYYCRYQRHIMKDCDFCSEGERRMK